MAIDGERDTHTGVSQHLADHLHRHSTGKQQRCCGMAQIMWADTWKSRTLEQRKTMRYAFAVAEQLIKLAASSIVREAAYRA
jgi:translation initiation factor 2B subunit (eIF-2B alpha/beta/delta family)